MNILRTDYSPGLLRMIGAIALAIVLAVGGSTAIAGFLTDWGRDGKRASRQSATEPSQLVPATSATVPSSSSPTSEEGAQAATALQVIATAETQVRHGKAFDLRDHDDGGQRVWSAKVADPDGRQFNLTISHDGSSVVSINEDKTPDDDVHKLWSAKVGPVDAIDTAVERAKGKGNLTSLEIGTTNGGTVVWEIEFGGDHGTTVLVDGTTVLIDATSGEVLDIRPDTD